MVKKISKFVIKVMPSKPDGFTKDLPNLDGTTKWHEDNCICPNNENHKLIGSTDYVRCPICQIYWKR